jgi:hypothetical protein
MLFSIERAGALGVIRDLSAHELPAGAWTDALDIRFLDGSAHQFLGHGEVYNSPAFAPQYVMQANVGTARYWLYATAGKCFAVSNSSGTTTHTDITHATPRAGTVNAWTGCVLGGIPILNAGDGSKPMYWNQNLASDFVDLTAWPATHSCKVLRSWRQMLVALYVTKGATNYPYMVRVSHPADPGGLPPSWDETDATRDVVEFDLAEGQDPIIDGMQLRDSFMVYKESSVWRLDYVGGQNVVQVTRVLGTSGAMNRNCIVEIDGYHVVLTGSDVIVHDGQSATSVLDKQARRDLFQSIDATTRSACFLFKNPFLNEVFVCYPAIGSTVCNKALVWNYRDKTVSFRSLPNVNHANFGPVDNSLAGTIDQDSAPIDSDLTAFDGPDYTPDTARVMMGTADSKLFLLDASASFNGSLPAGYLERRAMSFGRPDRRKLVTGVRLRIKGNTGQTVVVKVAGTNDPEEEPVYTSRTHTIGSTTRCDCTVDGRYIALRIETGTAYQWRLDSLDIEYELGGEW